ncbi:MAG: MFS transporter [Candidatus Binatia bacterium]
MPKPRSPVPRAFFIVAISNFLFFLNFAFFFLLPLWVLEKGGGEETAGRVIGVAGLAGLLSLPAVGYFLDRFGRRRFMIGGMAVGALTSFYYLTIDSIGPELYLVRALQGISFTCAFTGAQTLAVLFAPPLRRAEAIGWFGISTILTHAISPAIGEELILRWGFETVFTCAGFLASAACLMACQLPPPPELVDSAAGLKRDPLLARRVVLVACLAMTCYGFGFGSVQTFVPMMMARLDLGRVGAFFAAWSLSAVATRLALGRTSDRVGRRRVIVPAMATMSLAVAMLAVTRSFAGVICAGVVFGLAQGLLYPTMNALVADWSSPTNIGRTQSLFSGSYSLGISLCAYLFGSIAENHGYTTMFVITLGLTGLGMAIFATGPPDTVPLASPEEV